MTRQQELNLERFTDMMVELIEKHSNVIDKKEMKEKLNKTKGEAKKNASSFLVAVDHFVSYNMKRICNTLSRKKKG